MAEASTTALIGFADSLSAPEVAWSLVESGFRVVAFAKAGTHPGLRESRLVRVDYITDPAESIEAALADLRRLVRGLDRPILISLDDATLWLFQHLSQQAHVRVAGATGRQAQIALDKRLQLEAAAAAGFAVPDTRYVESAAELKSIAFFPSIVKPALAARAVGDRLGRARAHAIADRADLKSFAAQWNRAEPMLAQQLLDGIGEGVFGLVLNGRVVCWSGHRRIRMMNPAGSGASACVSMAPDAEVRILAERFLHMIEWRGMFMIELLRDSQGRLWFMELNGRSWGSMALARRIGCEYPGWTVQNMLDPGFVPIAPRPIPPVMCRHLGGELLHLVFVWRGARSRAYARWPGRMAALRHVLRVQKSDSWYNRNRRDPRVFWSETWETVASRALAPFRRKRSRSVLTRVLDRLRRPAMRQEQAALRASGVVRDRVKGCQRILFVCHGNINRSALAEQHLKQLVGPILQIDSCGFHETDGRPLDPIMRSLADKAGIHFGTWSSRSISHQKVAQADLIVAMEVAHLMRLFSEYPPSRGRAFLLSCVTSPDTIPLEIADPFGGSRGAYARCIREITYATTAMAERLKSSHPTGRLEQGI